MLNSDIIVGVFSLVLAGVFWFFTRDLSKLGGIFVNYVLVVLTCLGVMVTIKGFIKPERIQLFESAVERNNVFIGTGILLCYLIVLPFVGFLPSSFLFFLVMTVYLGDDRFTTRNIVQSAVLSAVVVTLFYLIFKHVLEVPLPKGSLFYD
jgi:membrane protein YdbS with pleckstrin-like domain